MFIVTVVSRLLQSVEFFRSGFGRWFTLLFLKLVDFKLFLLPLVIFGFIKCFIMSFSSLCSFIRSQWPTISHGVSSSVIHGGGFDIVAIANTVLPIDETMTLVVIWFSIYAACAIIRFARAAWAAIPFKAT